MLHWAAVWMDIQVSEMQFYLLRLKGKSVSVIIQMRATEQFLALIQPMFKHIFKTAKVK